MENVVEYIVKQLVSNEDAVSITSSEEGNTVTILVKVADEDMGKVIGKGGKIAQSIRAIIKSISANSGKRYFVKIGEKEA